MKLLRTLSTSRLLLLLVAIVALAAGIGAAAVAASGGSGTTPPPKPLADALHDSLAGAQPEGVTAHITFTNNLLPSGALGGQVGSALISGASGRLWATNDGHGRLELQSDAGDVQIVWSPTEVSIFDASSNTVYRAALPQQSASGDSTDQTPTVPAVSEIESFLSQLGAHVDISDAQPDNVGGQPAYTVRVSPKEHGGLFGAGELSFDAARPVPLRVGIYAKGDSSPVLELAVQDISYGAVSMDDVNIAPPASAKVIDLGGLTQPSGSSGSDSNTPPITGLDAVRNAAQFPVVAPDTLAGRTREDIRLVGQGDHAAVVATYGQGLDAIVVVEHAAGNGSSQLGALPEVTINGAKGHELSTPLGTIVGWDQGNVSFVVAGSVEQATAEGAARELG